jgi:hypothetical protein
MSNDFTKSIKRCSITIEDAPKENFSYDDFLSFFIAKNSLQLKPENHIEKTNKMAPLNLKWMNEQNLEVKNLSIKISDSKNEVNQDFSNLKRLFKKCFFKTNDSWENIVSNLNFSQKQFLFKVLNFEDEYVLKNDFVLSKKLKRALNEILRTVINRDYNGKKLNFIRKLYYTIINKIKKNQMNKLLDKGKKVQRNNIFNDLFDFKNKTFKSMILHSLKEFKKKQTILCFTSLPFTKEFDLFLKEIMKHKWNMFKEILKSKYQDINFRYIQNEDCFCEILEIMCIISSGYSYLRNIYSSLF